MEAKSSEVTESKMPHRHQNANTDLEYVKEKKYPYPKSILFIISTEFCERFSFHGMESKSISIAN